MTIQTTATKAFDAAIGAGDFAVEKVKGFAGNVKEFDAKTYWTKRQKKLTKTYGEFATRGAKLRKNIANGGPVQAAKTQTAQARRQVKSAASSVRKAVSADVEATKSAAKKVG